jgi:lysophospholipase L1-like esterase
MPQPDLYIFGDSIGYGAWDEQGGWVDRLKQYFHKEKLANPADQGTEVYNLSIDGDESGDVAARIKTELLARRKPWSKSEDVVLVAIGTNDVYAEGEPDNFKFSARDYSSNLTKIKEEVEAVGLRVAFISLDPVDEARTNPATWGAYFWTNKRLAEFNQVLEDFCNENKLPMLNLYSQFLSEPNFKDMLFDGAHPNTRGHEYMFENILPFVIKLLEI